MKIMGPVGLEKNSRRTHRVRQPGWSMELVEAVLKLREEYPGWGRNKLGVMLQGEGWVISRSSVERILKRLKEREVLHETPKGLVKVKKRV